MKLCRRGHPYTPENTYVSPAKGRCAAKLQCRACRRVAKAKQQNIHSTSDAPLTPAQVRRLRDARADGVSLADLSARFGVPHGDVLFLTRGVEVSP